MPHTHRYQLRNQPAPLRSLPAAALRAVLREGYTRDDLKHDVLAGVVVGVVALPLSMALSIAVGAAPQNGLYTAIIAGFAVAALGGSRHQVSGPTAAFIVILAPLYAKSGLAGLLLSGLLAGLILIVMAVLRLGRLIQYVPHPVTTGFTAGIAVVIATLQLKDLLGLRLASTPEHYLDRVVLMVRSLSSTSWAELGVGLGTLAFLVLWPRLGSRLPAPLVALPVAAVAALLLHRWWPSFDVQTIGTRFNGIPRLPPLPILPWEAGGPEGQPLEWSFALIRDLLPGAFAIAMLGAIESLLSAVVADGMKRTRHDPDAEMLGLGIGNVLAPFFGGIPATGALARTATNVRSGGRSPIASMVHALTVLASVLVLAPLIAFLPMASLASLLLLVAWNMSDRKHFAHILRMAPRSDVAVLLTCFGLTVLFDMVIAVTVGVVLAALLFMRRMVEVTEGELREETHPHLSRPLPKGVVLYDVNGPLFFGAAQRAMNALGSISTRARAVILTLDGVPAMDSTGLVALESALEDLTRLKCLIVLAGLQPQPRSVLERAEFFERYPGVLAVDTVEAAIALAEAEIERNPLPPSKSPTGRHATVSASQIPATSSGPEQGPHARA
jgi:SulP family sulfate permease